MLDLGLLRPLRKMTDLSPLRTAQSPDEAYLSYVQEQQRVAPGQRLMSRVEFERYALGTHWLKDLQQSATQTAKKLVQTCRLMVGIQDYEYYLMHMRTKHPEATPLSRQDFYRYCLDARFPGSGNLSKCPC